MIHVFKESGNHPDVQWVVWHDTDAGRNRDGLCIGVGDTRDAALNEAQKELCRVLKSVKQLRTAYHTIAES